MSRLLTFRFDDGFMLGARKSAKILAPHCGSYFVVADRVLGVAELSRNPRLAGRDFGSIGEWRSLAADGLDVQAHSYSHRPFSQLDRIEQENEVRQSVALVRSINTGPVAFAFPFNDCVDGLDWADLGVSGAGFDTRPSDLPLYTNASSAFHRFALRSWAVRERHWEYIASELRGAPDHTWTILGLHSLDDEGAEAWTSDGFAKLVQLVERAGFDIVTVQQVLSKKV